MKVNMRLFIIGSSLMPIHEGFEPMNGIHEPSFVFANSYQLLLAISIGVFFLIRRYNGLSITRSNMVYLYRFISTLRLNRISMMDNCGKSLVSSCVITFHVVHEGFIYHLHTSWSWVVSCKVPIPFMIRTRGM